MMEKSRKMIVEELFLNFSVPVGDFIVHCCIKIQYIGLATVGDWSRSAQIWECLVNRWELTRKTWLLQQDHIPHPASVTHWIENHFKLTDNMTMTNCCLRLSPPSDCPKCPNCQYYPLFLTPVCLYPLLTIDVFTASYHAQGWHWKISGNCWLVITQQLETTDIYCWSSLLLQEIIHSCFEMKREIEIWDRFIQSLARFDTLIEADIIKEKCNKSYQHPLKQSVYLSFYCYCLHIFLSPVSGKRNDNTVGL